MTWTAFAILAMFFYQMTIPDCPGMVGTTSVDAFPGFLSGRRTGRAPRCRMYVHPSCRKTSCMYVYLSFVFLSLYMCVSNLVGSVQKIPYQVNLINWAQANTFSLDSEGESSRGSIGYWRFCGNFKVGKDNLYEVGTQRVFRFFVWETSHLSHFT